MSDRPGGSGGSSNGGPGGGGGGGGGGGSSSGDAAVATTTEDAVNLLTFHITVTWTFANTILGSILENVLANWDIAGVSMLHLQVSLSAAAPCHEANLPHRTSIQCCPVTASQAILAFPRACHLTQVQLLQLLKACFGHTDELERACNNNPAHSFEHTN